MYYLINSTNRLGETFKVETRNNVPIPGNNYISGLTNDSALLVSKINIPDLNFAVVSGKTQIGSSSLYFTLGNTTSNTQYANVANLLGFTDFNDGNLVNTLTSTNNIDQNLPIYNGDLLRVYTGKINDYNFEMYPAEYSVDGLCLTLRDKLIEKTGRSGWNVVGNTTGFITFSLSGGESFNMLWNNMYNLALALGYNPVNSNTFYASSTAVNVAQPYRILTEEDLLKLVIRKQNIYTGTRSYQLLTTTTTTTTFIGELQDSLLKATGVYFDISINTITNKLTIAVVDSATYSINLLFSDTSMSNLATSLGFTTADTGFVSTITAPNAINITNPLNPLTDIFKLDIKTTTTINVDESYSVPVGKPLYRPNILIQNLQKRLISQTARDWSVDFVSGNTKIELLDSDSGFIANWGNMTNWPRVLGFANITGNTYLNSQTGNLGYNFNSYLNYSDVFKYSTRTTRYFNVKTYIIPMTSGYYYPIDYLNNITLLLKNYTGIEWTIEYDTSITSLKPTDTTYTFKILFGTPEMANIAKVMGYPPINMTDFVSNYSGVYPIDYSAQIYQADRLSIVLKKQDYDFSTTLSYLVDQPYYKPINFINALAGILNTNTGKTWSVVYNSGTGKVTISCSDASFRIMWGDPRMSSVSEALGFYPTDMKYYYTSVESDTSVNLNMILDGMCYFVVKYRTTSTITTYPTITANTVSYPIPSQYFVGNNFISNLPNILYSATGRNWTTNINANLMNIAITDAYWGFKFFWGNVSMGNIANVLGFSNTDMSNYEQNITGVANINGNITLSASDILTLQLINTAYTTPDAVYLEYSYSEYSFYLDQPFLPPDYYFQTIQNEIYRNIPFQMNLVYNNTASNLVINSPYDFKIYWSGMPTMSVICGTAATSMTNFANNFVCTGQVSMMPQLNSTDHFRVDFLSNTTTIETSFYDICKDYYVHLLNKKLTTMTGNIYPWYVGNVGSNTRVDMNTYKYRFDFGNSGMANIANIYGFYPNTGTDYYYSVTGNLGMNFTYNLSGNSDVIIDFEPRPNTVISNTITMEPRFYPNANIFCNIVEGKLNAAFTSTQFTCNYLSNENQIEIESIPSTNQFRFTMGSAPMTARRLGIEPSNYYPYSNVVVSSKPPTIDTQLAQIGLDLRSQVSVGNVGLISATIRDIYNINDQYNRIYFTIGSTEYIAILPSGIYTASNLTNRVSTALNTAIGGGTDFSASYTDGILSITNSSNPFSLDWTQNGRLAQILGYNQEISPFIQTQIGAFMVDLDYPKTIFMELNGMRLTSAPIQNNRATFFIERGTLLERQIVQLKDRTNINRLNISLTDENGLLLAVGSNWQSMIDFQ